ncbi:aldo/keto reductase [Rhizomicrobium electricum]|uniref:Aldo/keto reductase n=1 Tax=Rhizomicrobium electricum TaxID=480070 RepID=A0ABP3P8K4_9PROT|nr:aldo/keto reductase [Rhizomicrobium electricum]NIJ47713.1 aryl-alcohol dehydrogenase-like predicted oxidoreductase [Rhizomicrobium electricum]
MRYRMLGNTGFYVSEICLGTMTFGGKGNYYEAVGKVDQKTATRLVARALESGVNFIDTADVYSEGLSETLLGNALKDIGVKRSDVVIATKVYGRMSASPNDAGLSRGHIMDSIAASLERLQLDHVDLYQVHAQDRDTPVETVMEALNDLVRQGLVRYAGVSNWQAWRIMKAQGIADKRGLARFETLQAYYSIAGRDIERDVVPMLADQKMGLMVWSPLAGGVLSGKFGRDGEGPAGTRRAQVDFPPVDKELAFKLVDAMREIGAAHGASPARVALAWVLSRPFVTSVITGVKTLEQLDDNLAAADLKLSDAEIARLDALSALKPEYPAWMVERQNDPRRNPNTNKG